MDIIDKVGLRRLQKNPKRRSWAVFINEWCGPCYSCNFNWFFSYLASISVICSSSYVPSSLACVMNICNVWLKSAHHGRMLSRMSRDGWDCYFSWLKSGRSKWLDCSVSKNKNTREEQTRRRATSLVCHITIFVPHRGVTLSIVLFLSDIGSHFDTLRRANRNWVGWIYLHILHSKLHYYHFNIYI